MRDSFELKVDYHIHSVYSDGQFTPVELVKRYHGEEYDEIAITDHDGVGGIHDAAVAGEAIGLKVITGVELSTDYLGHNVHLLGYKFDPESPELLKRLEEIRQYRHDRNVILLQRLREMGFDISIEELEKQSRGGYVGKPNIARIMAEKGYIQSPADAFSDSLFGSKEIKSIIKKKISIEEGISLILNAGGIPVLAHPVKLKFLGSTKDDIYWSAFEEMLKYLKKQGLKGLECYYPRHDEEDTWKYLKLAEKYHLHPTRGSDFHGEDL